MSIHKHVLSDSRLRIDITVGVCYLNKLLILSLLNVLIPRTWRTRRRRRRRYQEHENLYLHAYFNFGAADCEYFYQWGMSFNIFLVPWSYHVHVEEVNML